MKTITQTTLTLILFFNLISASAQNVAFTIDNATTSGGIVTETVTIGGDTFTLTATHSSNSEASLFNNGGGDLLFFWGGSGVPNTNWEITVTQNGSPIAFDLVSLGFAGFVANGNIIDVTNNSGDPISTGVTINNGQSGDFPIENPENITNINSFLITGTTQNSLVFVDFHNIVIVPGEVLSINSNELSNLQVYPNPANDFLTIETGTLNDKLVRIFDISGKLVLDTIVTKTLNTSNLQNGLYILEIQENDAISTSKLIIQ